MTHVQGPAPRLCAELAQATVMAELETQRLQTVGRMAEEAERPAQPPHDAGDAGPSGRKRCVPVRVALYVVKLQKSSVLCIAFVGAEVAERVLYGLAAALASLCVTSELQQTLMYITAAKCRQRRSGCARLQPVLSGPRGSSAHLQKQSY